MQGKPEVRRRLVDAPGLVPFEHQAPEPVIPAAGETGRNGAAECVPTSAGGRAQVRPISSPSQATRRSASSAPSPTSEAP
jgi:hypothetical protein